MQGYGLAAPNEHAIHACAVRTAVAQDRRGIERHLRVLAAHEPWKLQPVQVSVNATRFSVAPDRRGVPVQLDNAWAAGPTDVGREQSQCPRRCALAQFVPAAGSEQRSLNTNALDKHK